jgi:hypothetical protein
MLTSIEKAKARVGINPGDTTQDETITRVITAVGQRFETECRRKLERLVDDAYEFRADETRVVLERYPIESVNKFQLKCSEALGWVDTPTDYLRRRNSVLELVEPLGGCRELARVIYTGGYAGPDQAIIQGTIGVPADLEHACLEQFAAWWYWKDKVGLSRHRQEGAVELEFTGQNMLSSVAAILRRYTRVGA